MNFTTQIKWIALSALVTLSGCSTQGIYNTPIEDRSTTRSQQESNGIATPVDITTGVTVTPVAPTPVFRTQRGDTALGPSTSVPVAPKVVLQSQPNSAVVALLETARQQTNSGELRSAQTSLQRAQRISPKDPEVYYSLADTHRRLGEFLQAEQVALKGVAIAQGQNSKLRRLWQLIASIRTDAGDLEGADKASGVARRY
ncbi:tetratricopeptide repeat protein [Neptunomonas qingdaonensis]|uniref:Tetratricopeptide repeat-containing protein n=1 Tax=Neptunomonas qingdaonensis TaxID=1045558 RepID=A0A1I2VZF7_9GAMM|nr:tetratricopeptide repeat protein [Neptunomonas qingdaonensis]SFG93717.1 Tetratricopeptide repeat-containing protein [Neptunomonas qingdaonensis]